MSPRTLQLLACAWALGGWPAQARARTAEETVPTVMMSEKRGDAFMERRVDSRASGRKKRKARPVASRYDFATGASEANWFGWFTIDRAPMAAALQSFSGVREMQFAEASPPETIVLSSFDGDASAGAVFTGSSWVGNVTQGAGFIAVGGGARDENGWGLTGLALDLSGMRSVSVVAQRGSGDFSGSLSLQLEDRQLGTHVITLSATAFSADAPSLVQVALGTWPADFDAAHISSWSIGGGGLGTGAFQMNLHQVEFSASAIPEPATWGAAAGVAAFAGAAWRRRRKRAASAGGLAGEAGR